MILRAVHAMLAQWILLVMMLPGWLVPSGVALSWCGCALRADVDTSAACCSVVEEVPSCCEPAAGTSEPTTKDCCCSVEAPEHDDGLAPATTYVPALPQLALQPAVLVPAQPHLSSLLDRCGPHDRPRGPSPGSLFVPLRL